MLIGVTVGSVGEVCPLSVPPEQAVGANAIAIFNIFFIISQHCPLIYYSLLRIICQYGNLNVFRFAVKNAPRSFKARFIIGEIYFFFLVMITTAPANAAAGNTAIAATPV